MEKWLKGDYKNKTFKDFAVGVVPISLPTNKSEFEDEQSAVDILLVKINDQGNKIRLMKSSGSTKVCNLIYQLFLYLLQK